MSDKIPSVAESQNNDRSALNVGGRNSKHKSLVIILLVLLSVVIVIVAVSISFNQMNEKIQEVETVDEGDNFIAGLDKSVLEESNNYFTTLKTTVENEKKKEEKNIKFEALVEPTPVVVVKSKPTSSTSELPTPEQRKHNGGVTVVLESVSSSSPSSRENDSSFNASSFEDGTVSLRKAGALDFMLIHGTVIPCALYTQIISDYEGFVTCRVTQDIYSANGSALLVERGSMVSGTQKVAMEQGKGRIFTSWADIETPLGVSIRIDSLGAGALGATGSEAWVDNHFSERFGAAILLSFVDDALSALSNEASKDNNVQFDNSTDNASDMASKALDSSINISPTGYTYIGQRINILVARDIDMSSVYDFRELH